MDPTEILERIGSDNPPTDEELAQARAELVAGLRAAATGDTPDLEAARSLRAAVDQVDAEIAERETAAQTAAEEAAALLEGIGVEDEDSSEEDGDPEDGDPEEESGEEEPPAEEEAPEAETQPEPVAAALQRARSRSTVRVTDEPEPVDVIVNGPAQNSRVPGTLEEAAALFSRHAPQVQRARQSLLQLERRYPQGRRLGDAADVNTRLIEDALSPRALVAAGGICPPVPADFAHPICGDRGRPITQSLPNFGATRGGVRFMPTQSVGALTEAITVWTHDNDESPGDPATKACPRINCDEETMVLVDAIVACLTVGNFQARFSPESWRAALDLLMVEHDRVAEQTHFATMQTAATAVTVSNIGNTAQSLLLALDRAASGIRSRHRLLGTQLRLVAPDWLRQALRASIARQGPGDGVEALAIADATMANFFSTRGITPVWSPDLQVFGAQSVGALEDWPDDEAVMLLYPEGTFFFLDGGTLDLGTEVTDSTLNATNDRQAFMETFEQVAFRGCEALQLTVPIGEDCVCMPELAAS